MHFGDFFADLFRRWGSAVPSGLVSTHPEGRGAAGRVEGPAVQLRLTLIGDTANMRVLLVEDEVRLAENVATALREGPSFAVDIAEDGLTGLDLSENRCYDLLILDL